MQLRLSVTDTLPTRLVANAAVEKERQNKQMHIQAGLQPIDLHDLQGLAVTLPLRLLLQHPPVQQDLELVNPEIEVFAVPLLAKMQISALLTNRKHRPNPDLALQIHLHQPDRAAGLAQTLRHEPFQSE
jgi:hypothetical protein